ncbi:MAG: hypothetical protein JXA09_18240, partial [Anaerolineae bacterium]|nr:hypothetical protein [Anaerolineae bacterium]
PRAELLRRVSGRVKPRPYGSRGHVGAPVRMVPPRERRDEQLLRDAGLFRRPLPAGRGLEGGSAHRPL